MTNNELFEDASDEMSFVDGCALDVLHRTRDYVHRGHSLISSPVGASIRMLMSPIRSVIISKSSGELDEYSLSQIETAIEKYHMITENRGEDFKNADDYRIIDKELTMAAIAEAAIFFGGDGFETRTENNQN